jgi:hypothetical protein
MPFYLKVTLACITYVAFIHFVAKFCGFNNRTPKGHN